MDETDPGAAMAAMPTFQLYRLGDVGAALGTEAHGLDEGGYRCAPDVPRAEPTPDTEQGARIRAIIDRGEAGSWRRLAHPPARRDRGRRRGCVSGRRTCPS